MDHGLEELDALLDPDPGDPTTRLATANSEATIGLIASLREARGRAGLRQRDVAERMGLKRQSSVADVERLGSDPHLSTLRRYATAIGARLELAVIPEDKITVALDRVMGRWSDEDEPADVPARISMPELLRLRPA